MRQCVGCAAVVWASVAGACAAGPAEVDVRAAMEKSAAFFQSISVHGGYAGIYSPDLEQRYGEALYEKARKTEIWIQPPGTPTVGEAFLRAWRATGDQRYFQAARNVARALAWAQSAHGGWDHRADVSALTPEAAAPQRRKTHCTFDDRISQGALGFLMSFDQVADEPWLSEAVDLAFKHLLAAQDAKGGWPQWYPLRGGYHDHFTFNDGTINDCIAVLLRANDLYRRKELLDGARRGGDFIVLSQLPAPQAGWAQQYTRDLKPASARAFEPAGVCSAVTARNIRMLIELYLVLNDERYLQPVPKARAWLDRSKLADGKWARFYEAATNRPIYGDRDGKVHYTLEEISEERRTGYSWQSDYGIASALKLYDKVKQLGRDKMLAEGARPPSASSRKKRAEGLAAQVSQAIAAMDAQGRWITKNMIHCKDFVRNFNLLCEYLELLSDKPGK